MKENIFTHISTSFRASTTFTGQRTGVYLHSPFLWTSPQFTGASQAVVFDIGDHITMVITHWTTVTQAGTVRFPPPEVGADVRVVFFLWMMVMIVVIISAHWHVPVTCH